MDLSQAMKRARTRTERQIPAPAATSSPVYTAAATPPLTGAPEPPLSVRDSTSKARTSNPSQKDQPKREPGIPKRTQSPSDPEHSRTKLEKMRNLHQQNLQASEADDLASGLDESLAQVDLLLKQLKTLVKVSKHSEQSAASSLARADESKPSTISRISKAPSVTSRILSALIPNQEKTPTSVSRLKTLVENGLRSSSPEHSETRLEMALKALGIEKGREYAVHSLEQAIKKLTRPDHPWSIIMDEMNKEVSIAKSVVDPIHSSVGGIQSSVEG